MKQNLNVKQKEFIKDFRDLLLKYGADISWTCDECSDTFGLVDDHLVISMRGQKDINLCGVAIDHYDLDNILKGCDNDENMAL